MSLMRPLMVRRLVSHSAKSFSSFRTVLAMRAPYAGGLLISLRCKTASCEAMRVTVSVASGPGAVTKWKAPARWP